MWFGLISLFLVAFLANILAGCRWSHLENAYWHSSRYLNYKHVRHTECFSFLSIKFEGRILHVMQSLAMWKYIFGGHHCSTG